MTRTYLCDLCEQQIPKAERRWHQRQHRERFDGIRVGRNLRGVIAEDGPLRVTEGPNDTARRLSAVAADDACGEWAVRRPHPAHRCFVAYMGRWETHAVALVIARASEAGRCHVALAWVSERWRRCHVAAFAVSAAAVAIGADPAHVEWADSPQTPAGTALMRGYKSGARFRPRRGLGPLPPGLRSA